MLKEVHAKDFSQKRDGVYLKGSGQSMLIVKADWCGYCIRALPELEEVSKVTGNIFPIYKLDCDKNKKILGPLGVNGYPTIFFISKEGKVSHKYNGERTKRAILAEIQRTARF